MQNLGMDSGHSYKTVAKVVKGETDTADLHLYESALRAMELPSKHYLAAVKKWWPSLRTIGELMADSNTKIEKVSDGYRDLMQRMMVAKPLTQEDVNKHYGSGGYDSSMKWFRRVILK